MTTRVYFHGVPGSAREWTYFAPEASNIVAPDHLTFSAVGDMASALPTGRLHLIGFSLGAFAALRLAALLDTRIARLDLISPAGPLELGDFLPDMAGGAIFRMARDHPARLSMMIQASAILTRIAPASLFALLFRDPKGKDAHLAQDPAFRAMTLSSLKQTFGVQKQGYRTTITAYAKPWADEIKSVAAPVHIWQGAEDDWTPPAMAEALARTLPNVQSFSKFEGEGHYSTLAHVLPNLLG